MKNNKDKNIKILLTFLALFSVIFGSNFSSLSFQLPVAIAQNNTKAEADRLRQLGEKQLAAGQYVIGTNTLEQAMRIYQQIGKKKIANEVRDRLIRIYGLRGVYDKYEQLTSEQAEENYQQEEQKPKYEFQLSSQIRKLLFQGITQQNRQDFAGAEKYFLQALFQAQATGREQDKIVTLAKLGGFYIDKGDFVKALANLEPAERLSAARYRARKPGSSDYEQEILINRIPILLLIAETYLQKQQPNQALLYIQEVDAITPRPENWDDISLRYIFQFMDFRDPSLYLGRIHYSLGNYNVALTYAHKAIKRGKIFQNYYEIHGNGNSEIPRIEHEGDLGSGHGHVLAGIALEKLGHLEQAEQELRKATQLFESIRKKSRFQGYNRHIFKLFNNQVRATSSLQRVLLAQNKSEEALAASEWGRARLSLEAATAPSNLTLKEKVDALVDIVYTPEIICQRISQDIQYSLDSYRRVGVDRIYNSEGKAFLLSDLAKFDCNKESEEKIRELKESWLKSATQNPANLDELVTLASKSPSNIKPPVIDQLKQIAQSHQATIVQYSIISETTFFHPAILPYDHHNAHWNAFSGEEQKLVIWVIKPTGEIKSRQIDLGNQTYGRNKIPSNRFKKTKNYPQKLSN